VASFIELAIFLLLLGAGYFVGRIIEQRHYASIRLRERRLRDVLAFPMRFAPDSVTPQNVFLVYGTVVVSADYFKTFVAGLRNLVGGRFRSYESLLERARREALLRLKAEALRKGARLIVCVRYETTSIARGWAPAIEVLAYGTALAPVAGRRPSETA
jgi:uncharacterized protein YbjQ (UPF0145 family)